MLGLSDVRKAQAVRIIRSFKTDAWQPRFLNADDQVPEDAFVFVSCDEHAPTSGNYLQVLSSDPDIRARELVELGVSVTTDYANHPRLIALKRAKRGGDGTYIGKPLLYFTMALKVALQVPKKKKETVSIKGIKRKPSGKRRGDHHFMTTRDACVIPG